MRLYLKFSLPSEYSISTSQRKPQRNWRIRMHTLTHAIHQFKGAARIDLVVTRQVRQTWARVGCVLPLQAGAARHRWHGGSVPQKQAKVSVESLFSPRHPSKRTSCIVQPTCPRQPSTWCVARSPPFTDHPSQASLYLLPLLPSLVHTLSL